MAHNLDNQIWQNKHFPDPVQGKEDIILVLRQDLIIVIFQILPFLIAFLILTLARAVLSRFAAGVAAGSSILDISYFTVTIGLLTGFFMRFHDYFLSMQIVTSERIIDVTQRGLFTRELNELSFKSIEDVTFKQSGLAATLFNFGDIIIQTAASPSNATSGFIFKNIPGPAKVHKIVVDILHDNANENDGNTTIINQMMPAAPNTNFNPNQRYPNPLPVTYRQKVIEHNDPNLS